MRRGEIYFVNLDPVVGREQFGTRPVLVVSIDRVNSRPLVVTVVPGTDAANVRVLYSTQVFVPVADSGLPMDTVFHCFQARALDHGRFPARPVGVLHPARMDDIAQALRITLGL